MVLFNFINSINGFKIVLKEHSFKAEIIVGIVLIPFLFATIEIFLAGSIPKIFLSILFFLTYT